MTATHDLAKELLELPNIPAVVVGAGFSADLKVYVNELNEDFMPEYPHRKFAIIHLAGEDPNGL